MFCFIAIRASRVLRLKILRRFFSPFGWMPYLYGVVFSLAHAVPVKQDSGLLELQCKAKDPHQWGDPQLQDTLKYATILERVPMREYLKAIGKGADFDGQAELLTLEGGVKGVFKPLPEEEISHRSAWNEVGAYKLSQYLKFPYVPPTVIREVQNSSGHRQMGSLQLFVETSLDLLNEAVFHETLSQVLENDSDQLAALKLFYFVIGQWDTGPHNLLVYPYQGRLYLVAIDHECVLHPQYVRYGEIPLMQRDFSETLPGDPQESELFPFHTALAVLKHPMEWISTPSLLCPTPVECVRGSPGQEIKKRWGGHFSDDLYAKLDRHSSVQYIVFKKALWIQFCHAYDGESPLRTTKVDHAPEWVLEALQRLTFEVLEGCFCPDRGLHLPLEHSPFCPHDFRKCMHE